MIIEQRTRTTHRAACDRETSVTRSLLGYGVIAGPVYVAVSLAQALTRDGFDLTRHSWSLPANGDLGWIHIADFMVTAAATLACAVGLRRALGPGRGGAGPPGRGREEFCRAAGLARNEREQAIFLARAGR